MTPREDKGDREGIPPVTPYSIRNSFRVIFKTVSVPFILSLDDAHANFTGFHLKVTMTVLNAKNWKRFPI